MGRSWKSTWALVAVALLLAPVLPAAEAGAPARPEHPSPRWFARAVYDSKIDRIIMFGGGNVSSYNETWEYDLDTNTWHLLHPKVSPRGRMGHNMAYDAQSDRTILFGGTEDNMPCSSLFFAPLLGDTWAFDYDNNTWEEIISAHVPTPRWMSAMAYDAESDRVVLFGGQEERIALRNDTWAFDYETRSWERRHPAVSPDARPPEGMVYDEANDRLVFTGGWAPWAVVDSETWAYDYNADNWSQIAQENKPSDREMQQLAYDSAAQAVIRFGGNSYDSYNSASDLQRLDVNASQWVQVANESRTGDVAAGVFVYDAQSRRIFLFSGANVTLATGCWGSEPRYLLEEQWSYDAGANEWTALSRPGAPDPFEARLQAYDEQPERGDIELTWSAAAPPNGTALGGFNVYRNDSAGNLTLIFAGVDGNRLVDAGVRCGGVYAYAVAQNSSAGEGELSATRFVQTPACRPVAAAPPPGILASGELSLLLLFSALVALGVAVFVYRRRGGFGPDD